MQYKKDHTNIKVQMEKSNSKTIDNNRERERETGEVTQTTLTKHGLVHTGGLIHPLLKTTF